MSMDAAELFENALEWLRLNYAQFQFFAERDVVWTLQRYISSQIKLQGKPYSVFNDFPILPGNRRSICADLVLLNEENSIEVAAEFKYEPSHLRRDIWPTKLNPSVVFWGNDGVKKDVERVQEFVERRKAKIAYSIFIDENGLFRHRLPHPGTIWVDWKISDEIPHRVSLLWSRVSLSNNPIFLEV